MVVERREQAFDTETRQGAHAAQPGSFEQVRRLVPSSGLQFLDATIGIATLPMVRQWYTEDEIESTLGKRRVLLPLATDSGSDGTIWHPVTFRPLGPTETMSFTGLEAIEPFLDTWVPVPFFRALGSTDGGALRFDQGPTNWARIFVAKPAEGLRGAQQLKAVFAFDSRLDHRSRADQAAYLAPNIDDAMFSSTFLLVDTPEDLSGFLGAPWIDVWLKECCAGIPTMQDGSLADLEEAGFEKTTPEASRFTLTHIARYLTFLKILKRAASPPQIRFIDSVSNALPVARSGFDLVVDVGPAETTALLFERNRALPPDIAMAQSQAFGLRLRDLTDPVTLHTGPIATVIEFDNQTFGNAAHSRRSGRPDAFTWTSLVRIGAEAQRLALRVNATEGVTGLSDIASGLDQTGASSSVWRFSTTDGGSKSSPMVTGDALRYLSETGDMAARADGLLAGPGGESAPTPTMRPRFSPSSLIGFFIVELLLHTISELNSADAANPFAGQPSDGTAIRHIERIVIATPIAMPVFDRQLLVERVHNAIDLVWRTQQWDQPGPFAHPAMPQVTLGIGADVGMQLVYLFNEVRRTFKGGFTDLVDCVRRRTGEPDARDNLRISSIDLGQRTAGLIVVDYDIAHDGTVQARLVKADRAGIGAEQVIRAIVDEHVVPAIEAQLAASGLADPRRFLMDLPTAADDKTGGRGGSALGLRFATKLLRPAALAVFQTYVQTPRMGAGGVQRFRLDALVEAGGGRLEPLAAQFNAAAQAAGAKSFNIATVCLVLGRRHIKRLVETELWPAVNTMTDAIERSESDLLLVGGDLAALPDLLDHVLARAPVAAGRIVIVAGDDALAMNDDNGQDTPQSRALLGAYMAGRNRLDMPGFTLVTRDIAPALAPAPDHPPHITMRDSGDRDRSDDDERLPDDAVPGEAVSVVSMSKRERLVGPVRIDGDGGQATVTGFATAVSKSATSERRR